MKRSARPVAAVVFLILAMPDAVFGYIGPGAGLTIIGAALAFIASIVLGLFGFVWYPLKRMARAFRRSPEEGVEKDA